MKLMTKKYYIVIYHKALNEYLTIDNTTYHDTFSHVIVPVLYTNNIMIARKTKQKLNNLRA